MCQVIHLEPEDFAQTVSAKKLSVYARVYVLDAGIAGLVYMCSSEHSLYYLDRFIPTPQKREDFERINFYDVHKDLYRKINLDTRIREKNKQIISA